MAWNKQEAEYNLTDTKLTHSFALKMASMICWSVVTVVLGLGIFFGDKSLYTFIGVGVIALILGIITFSSTRSACM